MREKKNPNSAERLYKFFIYLVLIMLAVSIIIPVAWVFMASIKQNKEFYGNPWTLPEGFYFQNFIDAWNTDKNGRLHVKLRIGYSFGTCNSFNCCAAGSLLFVTF